MRLHISRRFIWQQYSELCLGMCLSLTPQYIVHMILTIICLLPSPPPPTPHPLLLFFSFISQPTRFFPLRPCSTASVLFLHTSSSFRLRALKDPHPLSHSFNTSLSARRQQLPVLLPGDYVIEDQGGGCEPLQFRVSGAMHCSPHALSSHCALNLIFVHSPA
jgi:hypothetical protein